MNTKDTISFYNKESTQYSKKRYEGKARGYVQYSFRKRFTIALGLMKSVSNDLKGKPLLEVGCADGVILRMVNRAFPGLFSRFVGTDIAPEMIEAARAQNDIPNAAYAVRGEEELGTYGLILELGVHTHSFESELQYVKERLIPGGYFIYSVSAPSSLYTRLKMPDKAAVKEYLSYAEYPPLFEKYFKVIKRVPCGFFVPKLWTLPFVGRLIQPVVEVAFRFMPNLYHEHVYLLQRTP